MLKAKEFLTIDEIDGDYKPYVCQYFNESGHISDWCFEENELELYEEPQPTNDEPQSTNDDSYKRRMLIELIELSEKMYKLDKYIEKIFNKDNKKYKLMSKQFMIMNDYRDVLIDRILLEMEEKQ